MLQVAHSPPVPLSRRPGRNSGLDFVVSARYVTRCMLCISTIVFFYVPFSRTVSAHSMKKLGFSFYFSTGYLKEVHRGLTSVTLNTDFFFFFLRCRILQCLYFSRCCSFLKPEFSYRLGFFQGTPPAFALLVTILK